MASGRDRFPLRTKSDTRFPQTSWELLTEAGAAESGDGSALNEFTERYYAAVRAYVSAIVRNDAERDDYTQKFFVTVVINRRLLAGARGARGSFRSYLKQAIRNFLVDEHRARSRKKSQPALSNIHPDTLEGGWDRLIADSSPAPDIAFQRTWARSLVGVALSRVNRLCEQKGQREHFQLFAGRFLMGTERGWRELGAAFGLDEKTARSRADTVVRQFRSVLRELVAADSAPGTDIDAEIRALIALQ
jgi:RNA polymerase sigma factor (sigma-70 family)